MADALFLDPARGLAFGDEDVARCYPCRPPYAPQLYPFLLGRVSGRERALDLGCGPGKIALVLAERFGQVDAVDPSGPMLKVGARQDNGAHANIRWIQATAEAAPLDGPYDLITAGASLHWMDHAVVFPRLAAKLRPGGVLAVISGDSPSAAPWDDDWKIFLTDWLERLGHLYDERGFAAALRSYERWMRVEGRESFTHGVEQSLDDFIQAQHSRETWARSKMGRDLAQAFDKDLRALLAPHARNGVLRFDVTSLLVWGRPRTEPSLALQS